MQGLRDLKYFGAGGATCSDAVVSEVLKCKGLKRLTLAYSSASPQTLSMIAELSKLEYLVLTGSAVDDQVVNSIVNLSKLRTLRLDQTAITESAVSQISRMKQLQYLELGQQKLGSAAVSEILKLTELKFLNLDGCEVTAEHLAEISKLDNLEVLDLSHMELTNQQLDALAKSPPTLLRELKLNQTKLGSEGFMNLLRSLPSTVLFGLADTDIKSDLMDWLVNQNRVIEFSDRQGLITTNSNGSVVFFPQNNFGTIAPRAFTGDHFTQPGLLKEAVGIGINREVDKFRTPNRLRP